MTVSPRRPARLAAGTLVLAASLLATGSVRSPVQAQPLPEITVTSNAAGEALPFFYARAHGLFRKAGLVVHFAPATSGSADLVAVIGGAADIGFTNTLTFADAVAKGLPLEVVSAAEVYDSAAPLIRLLTLPNSPITNAADLDGKTIGVPGLHDEAWIATMAWVDEHGGDSKTLHFVEIPPPVMQAALRAHRVDAVTIFDPFAVQMASNGIRTLGYPGGAFAPRYMDTEWVAKRSWLAAHAVAAARFERVMSNASAYCTAHFKQLIPFMARFSKMPVASLEESAPEKYGRRVRAALLQPVIDEAVKYNHIKPFLASRVIFHEPDVSKLTGS